MLGLVVAAVGFAVLSLGLFALTVVLVETLLSEGPARPRKATLAAIVLIAMAMKE